MSLFNKKMKVIGGFSIGKTIGEGTFSKVKIATELATGKEYAMKIVKKNTINDPEVDKQIIREVSILHTIKHPNVVQLHAAFKSKKKYYLILDLADGGELFDKLVDDGPLPENEARKYFQQLIDALDCIHRHHAVHRDLKPENLLLDREGNLKVTDFGLSAVSLTSAEVFKTRCGTPNYVAPEIFSPSGYHGPPVDIWSAGLILYVMLTASLPFDGDSVESVIGKVLDEPLGIPMDIPDGAASLIEKIIVRDPEQRATIADIRNDEWFKVDYHQVNGEETNAKPEDLIFIDAEVETVSKEIQQDEPDIDAFSLISKISRVDMKTLFEGTNGPKVPTSFSVTKQKEKIDENIISSIKKLGGVPQQQKNQDFKASFIIGGKPLSVRIEVTHVVGITHVIELYKLRGSQTDFISLYNKFKTLI